MLGWGYGKTKMLLLDYFSFPSLLLALYVAVLFAYLEMSETAF